MQVLQSFVEKITKTVIYNVTSLLWSSVLKFACMIVEVAKWIHGGFLTVLWAIINSISNMVMNIFDVLWSGVLKCACMI